jgi:hypothetical protein
MDEQLSKPLAMPSASEAALRFLKEPPVQRALRAIEFTSQISGADSGALFQGCDHRKGWADMSTTAVEVGMAVSP